MKKHRGYFLIDVLFSISLIIIISTYIVPAIANNIFIMNKTFNNHENIKRTQNKMEEFIGLNYHREDFIILENSDNTVYEIKDIGNDLAEVKVKCKERDNETEFKIIIKKQGIYFD